MPTKSFDGDGTPNPDGPVHITGMSLELRYPNQIVTTIDGFDERPFPDVDFQIIVTYTLSINTNMGALACDSVPQLSPDLSWFQELIEYILSPFTMLITALLAATNGSGSGAPGTVTDCWAEMLAPQDTPIPGGQKFVMTYQDVQVTYEGVVLIAAWPPELTSRTPSVEIIGPRNLMDTVGNGAVGSTYRVELHDFLTPVHIQWFVDSNLVAGGEGERFVFRNITFLAPEGKTEVRRLKVSAEDADHLTAGEEISVTVTSRPPPGLPR